VRGAVGRRSLLLGSVGLLLVAFMAVERLTCLAHAAPTDFDDAYTYLRYAQHWLSGEGVAWNSGGGSVYGVTSLLHLAVVTAIRWAFPGIAMWRVLQIASGAAATGLLAALVAVAALATRHPRLSRNWIFWSGALVPLLAFREAFGFHAGTGMDTMLSALANAALIFFTLKLAERPTRARIALVVVAAALSVLARPDNLVCAALCPTLTLLFLSPRPRARSLVSYGVAFAGTLALLAVAAWALLGSPVPLSFFVKQPWYYGGFAGEFGWNPFRFLGVFLLSAWPFVVALVLFCDRAGWRRSAVLLVPALLTIGALFRFNQIMGHLGRFYYPLLPFFVVAAVLEFDGWLLRLRAGHRLPAKAMLGRAVLAMVVVLAIRAGLGFGADRYDTHVDELSLLPVGGYQVATEAQLPEIDSWESARQIAAIAAAAPMGASFAMSEHGLPGALAPQVVILDVLGLHDSIFARRGFSAGELFRRRPDFIWMPHSDHTEMLREIVASDDFWAHYDFYPDAFFHGIAIRTGGPYTAALAPLVAAAWQAAYPGWVMADHQARRSK
jgi:hypothetical protein